MGRSFVRFRGSVKDQKTGKGFKVELIDAPGMWGERRYRLRVNGATPGTVEEATLTTIFDRLRQWMVRQTEK